MAVNLDILLIVPNSRAPAYGPLAPLAAVEPPVWAGLLATFLLKKGYGVEILDAHALDLPAGRIGEEVARLKPRLAVAVAYGHQPSASTQTMPAAREALRAIRQAAPWTPTAILGGHPSALPERTLREEPVDFVVEGEGPYTLAALLDALKAGSSLEKVPGLWWKDAEGTAFRNAPAPLVKDLDGEMPGVAWEKLLPVKTFKAHNWHSLTNGGMREGYAALSTELGCPFHCNFCQIQAPFKSGERALGYAPGVNSYRRWSPHIVGEQLERLVAQDGVCNVKMVDEMHLLSRSHVEGICDEILRRGLGDHLNIWAYSRVDTAKWPDLLEKMRRAGYRWLALGIEASDSSVRDGQDKHFSDFDIVKTVRAIQAIDICVVGNFIVGLPGETADSMQRTLDLALELRCEWMNVYPALALPGSALYQEAVAKGWRLPSSWAGYAFLGYECVPLPTESLTSENILRFRDQVFFLRYFGDPEYLAMMQEKFGQAAVTDILEMVAAGPPKRKILGG